MQQCRVNHITPLLMSFPHNLVTKGLGPCVYWETQQKTKNTPMHTQDQYEDALRVEIMIVTVTELQQKKNVSVWIILGVPRTIDE